MNTIVEDKNGNTLTKFYLTIITANDDQKLKEHGFECKDMIDVTRTLLGFRAKRGYDFVTAHIDRVEVLL